MSTFRYYLFETKYSNKDLDKIKKAINGIDWSKIKDKQLLQGLYVELEHGKKYKQTNVTNDGLIKTAKIALAHLLEDPDYYTKLEKIDPHH